MKRSLRKLISAGILLSAALITTNQSFGLDAGTLPSLNSATNGSTSISGSRMDVHVTAPQGGLSTFNWNTFNVGKNAQVNYEFNHANQTALNVVSAAGGMSQIYGKITQTTEGSCANCNYAATGKVILLNPNGVYFGNGASVNLNSFTASSMNGVYDATNKELKLTKGANNAARIIVDNGATIYGDKAITLAGPNVEIYNGSKLTTSIAPNVGSDSYGKIKLVTADGVNFSYYNNGAVRQVKDTVSSADKMTLYVGGQLTSGNIDARNLSTNAASEILVKDAVMKATQAVSGNDGNIYLTANNKIVVNDSQMETTKYSSDATADGANIRLYAGNKVTSIDSTYKAAGNTTFESVNNNVVVDNNTVTSTKDVNVIADNGTASVQNNSKVTGNNVNITGKVNAQVYKSTITGKNNTKISGDQLAWIKDSTVTTKNTLDVISTNGSAKINDSTLKGKDINVTTAGSICPECIQGSTFTADHDINLTSTKNSVLLDSLQPFTYGNLLNLKAAKNVEVNSKDSLTVKKTTIDAGDNVFLTSKDGSTTIDQTTTFKNADNVYITGKTDVKTNGTVDMKGIKTTVIADENVNVTFKGVDNKEKGLVVKGGNDVVITTPDTLSVSTVIAGRDLTINADKVVAGKDYTTVDYPDKATTPRSYIEAGRDFKSNTAHDDYDTTYSYNRTNDGKYNQNHLIEYGNGTEKILLINKKEVEAPSAPVLPTVDPGREGDVVNPGDETDCVTPSTPVAVDPNPPVNPDPGPGTNPDPSNPDPSNPGPGTDPSQPCENPATGDEVTGEDAPVIQLSNVLNTIYSTNVNNNQNNGSNQ